MAINISEKIHINSTATQVATYMFDPQNDSKWISGILEVKSISTPVIGEGTEIHRVAHFLGKDVDYILKVIQIGPDRLVTESLKSPFPMKVSYVIDTSEDFVSEEGQPYCIVRIKIEGKSKGYFMFVDRLLALMVSQNVKGDLQKLKDIMEEPVPDLE